MNRPDQPIPRRRGFTIVELLVVIGIIVILIGILVPVISRVQVAAQGSETRQRLANIAAALQSYYNDFSAYPGPFSNAQLLQQFGGSPPTLANGLGAGERITMAENMVLGLLGGLQRPTTSGGQPTYDRNLVGLGAISMAPSDARKSSPYLEVRFGSPLLSKGKFTDEAGIAANDSVVPEFLDRFDNNLPILYLRANTGLPGVITDNGADTTISQSARYQYDTSQYSGYTSANIGVGGHGLNDLGAWSDSFVTKPPETANNALPYFKAPGGQPTGATNATGLARQRDGFILISAGPDRRYGTYDDVTNFGGFTNE